ncbi:MAG: septal ring lytic transglycosylase RlpA family protein [Chloroflexota bacterium]
MIEPDLRSEPTPAPVRPAQPVARAGSVAIVTPSSTSGTSRTTTSGTGKKAITGGWHHDNDISWFGPGLYGNGTACGKTLTKTLVGVAHRTLPCGTLVTFRYKGVTLTVPVVDRGPYVAGRTWDLTHGACAKLGHCFTGSIDWKLAGR